MSGVPVICPHCRKVMTHRAPKTAAQAAIYRFLLRYHDANGCMPSFQEIADHFDYRSLSTVHEHMDNLMYGGWLHRSAYNVARGYVFTEPVA